MLFERNCPGCGRPARTICTDCGQLLVRAGLVHVDGADWAKAAVIYDDLAASLILAGKNRGRRDILRHLAQVLVPAVPPDAQVITWVPANTASRRERGYDQGKIIASTVARAVGLPAQQLLRRQAGPSQVGQTRAGRLAGPYLESFATDLTQIVLVDDVMTTGASLTAATAALKDGGAHAVWALTVAAVP